MDQRGSNPKGKNENRPYKKNTGRKRISENNDGNTRFKKVSRNFSEKKHETRDFSKSTTQKRFSDDDENKSMARKEGKRFSPGKKQFHTKEYGHKEGFRPRRKSVAPAKKQPDTNEKGESLIRLNKYIADSGVCSRREADILIQSGVVKVNGEIVTQLGRKVSMSDKVMFGGETLKREKLRYLLLNKPKGFITTSDDPMDRKTVMALVENACEERIYPVGRLDRNTVGLLLFTNDGDLAKKLTHPKYGIKKVYHVFLDKALSKNDMIRIMEGVELEDGIAKPDNISFVAGENDKKQVGLELHSGKNRIVRRIFEHFGYEIVKLDRVMFASLTKKDLPRGKWRMLTDKEVGMLKMIS